MTISLAEDTISQKELESLSSWILAGNRLTKNGETLAFEAEFEEYMGVKHAIVTNSGSSSNLLMIYALKEAGYLRNNKVIAPAVSWVTTVSPLLQFGFDVSLCECDAHNLGLDINHLEQLCKTERPALMILVHVLGHANHMDEIQRICKKYDVLLIEDSCESLGSQVNGRKLGGLSTAGSFSFYYGHHISTIEGGMVVTNDTNLYHVMLSLRSHGWSRDLPAKIRDGLMADHGIDEFRNLYTFYYSGFNLRSTDLQAFIGRSQLKKLDRITADRARNYNTYRAGLADFFCQTSSADPVSSFAYGTLIENRNEVFEHLSRNEIECRPLICGNIGRHPFWTKRYGDPQLKNADIVHDFGIYMPNHHNLSEEHVKFVCETFKQVARPKHF
jgi:CDP-4-dehydro-6-deoxyglucose reductase, E1